MAKVIDKTVLSRKSPKTSALWAYPKDNDSVELRIFNNGEWQNISGTGKSNSSSSSSSDSGSDTGGSGCNCNTNQNTVTLTSETSYNDLKTLYDAAIIEKGLNKTQEEINSMSENEYGTYRKECMHALKDTTFISDRHGKSVNVLFDDTQNPPRINILYEDGYVVSYRDGYGTREIPPTMRYCYGRENMDEWLWDEFGERIGVDNAHTFTTTLYEPDSGMVYNLVYINPNPGSQTYPTYSRWATHYQYTSEGTTEDRVDYIILRRRAQKG